jgi:hypothetical protein
MVVVAAYEDADADAEAEAEGEVLRSDVLTLCAL